MRAFYGVVAAMVMAVGVARGAGPTTLPLWKAAAPGALGETDADRPTIEVFLPPAAKATGIGVIVCPGGGYKNLMMSYEGRDVAAWLNENGMAGIVLKYRVAPYQHPIPMQDAQRAMRLVRSHKEWNIRRLGILGFSAGGHLASTIATHWDEGDATAQDPVANESCRPDFAVLIYPVISMEPPMGHGGSRKNLLGLEPDAKLVENLSNHKQVTSRTPPTFLVHSTTDKVVPIENSRLFHEACKKAGVKSELIVFDRGPHGFGLGTKDPVIATWPPKCIEWIRAVVGTK